ncbi:hypothetical protein FLP10_03605 [Agromyces intestinalis]|uniref:N-acetyltransferase n=1 Tax=Agromyces intestinalis TaxID=2592652 RepID=A0A5C1YF03_9MICO|nr:hypothetical protein [Agromyces intestinalis]QEO13607.1 hypothetical protein FLP10_03605 [Agromyces intestinalis]
MQPVSLRTARLVLDQPTPDDVDAIALAGQDPLIERRMTGAELMGVIGSRRDRTSLGSPHRTAGTAS